MINKKQLTQKGEDTILEMCGCINDGFICRECREKVGYELE